MTRRVAVRAIVMHEDKLLGVRLKPYSEVSATMANSWCVPGGGLDEGEPLIAGLEREMYEEMGIKAVVGNLLYIQQFVHSDKEHLEFLFHVTNSADYLHVDLTKASHGAAEIEEIAFIAPTTATLLPKFLMTEQLATKIARSAVPMLFSYL